MNPNRPHNWNRPSRDLVERIAREEAAAASASLNLVLGMSRQGQAVLARNRAFRRILRETGCSIEGLASVWGCHGESVRCAIAAPKPDRAHYDAETIEHLRWAHGEARKAQIVAGNDPRTQSDLAKWAGLGSRHGGRAA